jgi:HK97 family phage prohead protease
MKRAYSILEIKSVTGDTGKRRFTGIASTPTTDRMGDIVEPKGAQFKLPIPLLWQHDAKQPIGWITAARVTDKGIEVDGEVADIAEEGSLKNRLTEAWQMLKSKLVSGLSIGFNPLESADIKGSNWAQRFIKWEWLELSAVTIAANQEASITAIKSIDQRLLAASGRGQGSGQSADNRPGVSGTQQPASRGNSFSQRLKGKDQMKTLTEMREERTQKAARLQELLDQWKAEARSSTDEEADEFDNLTEEVKSLDDEIRVKQFEAANASAARAVKGASAQEGSRSRSPSFYVKSSDADEKFKGQNFTRSVIAKALSSMLMVPASAIAEARWGKSNPTLVRLIKANEIAGGGSGSGEWGAELVSADNRYTGDFIEYLHSMTVYDQLPLREVPANVTIKGSDGAATGYWVGESKPIPASAPSASTISLTPLKVAALAVVSNELLRDSTPAAESWIRDMLAKASSQRVDATFLSTTGASNGVSPAGILNGLSAGTSAGSDADGARSDIQTLMANFITAKNVSGLSFVTTPTLALALQLMRNALGQREFPDTNMEGGKLEGRPLVTGDNVGSGDLILLKPSDIWKIGDSGVRIDISRDAMVEQSSAPVGATDTPVAATEYFTSMFQAESTAIKVVRSINFKLRRSDAVAYMGNAAYSGGS